VFPLSGVGLILPLSTQRVQRKSQTVEKPSGLCGKKQCGSNQQHFAGTPPSFGTAQMETVVPHDQLLQLLQQTFGTKVELIDYKIGNRHHDYLVLLVQLRRPSIKVVVKLAGPEAPMACQFERTAMLHRLVATRTTIPMPEVLAVNMSYQTWPWRYFIKTHIRGQEWAVVRRQMNVEELSNAYQQIGNAVAQLHAIHFPTFGELAVDGSVQEDEPYFAAFTERARHSIKSARLRDLFFSVLDKQGRLFLDVCHASLCHEDLHGHNILFQHRQGQWHLATILDFDKAWAGHHEIDLARLEFWKGMMSNEFWWSYEAICPIEPLYKQRRPIYQLLWCLEYARLTAEHIADTQRLCAELGLSCLEWFE
jgi:aminoglycoside phosphotransferase (APT) family kinase protein